jgi:hypothetical protein
MAKKNKMVGLLLAGSFVDYYIEEFSKKAKSTEEALVHFTVQFQYPPQALGLLPRPNS